MGFERANLMIHKEFVKIAREVIKFVRAGNKLKVNQIEYKNNCSCPLGAVLVNNYLSQTLSYHKAYDLLDWMTYDGETFWKAFDKPIAYAKYTNLYSKIGVSLHNSCKRRGWIAE